MNDSIRPPTKRLLILTGPPGAGKLDYARAHYPEEAIYSQSLGNKSLWRDSGCPVTVFITSAPEWSAKDYWTKEAQRQGFIPGIVTYTTSRDEATRELCLRERTAPNERQRARLRKKVSRWYSSYEEYNGESSVNASNQSLSQAG